MGIPREGVGNRMKVHRFPRDMLVAALAMIHHRRTIVPRFADGLLDVCDDLFGLRLQRKKLQQSQQLRQGERERIKQFGFSDHVSLVTNINLAAVIGNATKRAMYFAHAKHPMPHDKPAHH